MKSNKKQVIRIGDTIKIVNPEIVKRVGYPLNKEIVKEHISKEKKNLIYKLLDTDPSILDVFSSYPSSELMNRTYNEILDRLAYYELKQNGFGGRERKIYTERNESYLNKTFEVIGKRVVKTGKYSPAHRIVSFDSFYDDYDPPCLDDEKTHVLLELSESTSFELFTSSTEIEECNVELVKRHKRWRVYLKFPGKKKINKGIFNVDTEDQVKNMLFHQDPMGYDQWKEHINIKELID